MKEKEELKKENKEKWDQKKIFILFDLIAFVCVCLQIGCLCICASVCRYSSIVAVDVCDSLLVFAIRLFNICRT